MTRQFRISKEGMDALRRKNLWQLPLRMGMVALIAFYIIENQDLEPFVERLALLIMIPALIVGITVGVVIRMARIRSSLESYLITVTEDSISKEHEILAGTRIMKQDITRITQDKKGTIVIEGRSKTEKIEISAYTGELDELITLLGEIRTIELTGKSPQLWQKSSFWLAIIAGLLIVFFLSPGELAGYIAGGCFLGVIAFALIIVLRSKQINRSFKLRTLIIIPLLLIVLIAYFGKAGTKAPRLPFFGKWGKESMDSSLAPGEEIPSDSSDR